MFEAMKVGIYPGPSASLIRVPQLVYLLPLRWPICRLKLFQCPVIALDLLAAALIQQPYTNLNLSLVASYTCPEGPLESPLRKLHRRVPTCPASFGDILPGYSRPVALRATLFLISKAFRAKAQVGFELLAIFRIPPVVVQVL